MYSTHIHIQEFVAFMSTFASFDKRTMLLLHVPDDGPSSIGAWNESLSKEGWSKVGRSLTVCHASASGFEGSMAHMPLKNSERFYLFKRSQAVFPTSNAFHLRAAGDKEWRKGWKEVTVIKPAEFKHQKNEPRLKPEEDVENDQTESGDLVMGMPEDEAFRKEMEGAMKRNARRYQTWLRFSQLSQGVLAELNKMICRVTLDQVCSQLVRAVSTSLAHIILYFRNRAWSSTPSLVLALLACRLCGRGASSLDATMTT